ncbi:MAG: hypothetical protein A1D16_10635 [Flavihumibacter sp. CACIAM 22H1]|nr:MAG: hypothetical protein A1D16_10635 [Flavihumibacter sp. CACIAM 22H1]
MQKCKQVNHVFTCNTAGFLLWKPAFFVPALRLPILQNDAYEAMLFHFSFSIDVWGGLFPGR